MANLKELIADPNILNSQRSRYVVSFVFSHRSELSLLRQSRVLGRESAGWTSVAEHCIMAGMMAGTLSRLFGLPEEASFENEAEAIKHDADKRLSLEACQEEASEEDGIVVIKYDLGKYLEWERGKSGITRVTGNDWRDYPNWETSEKILRYVDSSVGEITTSKKRGNNKEPPVTTISFKRAAIVNWRDRISDLEKRHPGINRVEGEELYGMPAYTRLFQIMEELEGEFYYRITHLRPEKVTQFPHPYQLNDLILDQLIADIIAKSCTLSPSL